AISWNLFTWYYGIPSSSSHTLIGGFAGSGMAYALFLGANPIEAINVNATLKIISFIVLAPVIGMTISIIINLIIINICRNSRPMVAEIWFIILQLISSAGLSFAHGGNDAQKVMGIIFVAMIAGGAVEATSDMPEWIPLSCYAA